MIQLFCTFSIDNHWRYGILICITTLIIHVRVRYFSTVLYCLHSRDSAVVHYVHFYRTSHTTVLYYICWLPFEILQSYWHYIIDNSNQDAIPNWSYDQIECNGNEIIEIMNRYWLNLTVTLQINSQNQERLLRVVSSFLTQENVCCPNFQNTSLAGNFGPQIWLPDGHFGQFRAIGPMELLRPESNPHQAHNQCTFEVWSQYHEQFTHMCTISPTIQETKKLTKTG